MNQVHISNELSRNIGILELTNLDLAKPWVMTLKPYKRDRSVELNAVSHGWYAIVAAKLREDTAAGVKGFCKLHYGVPILRTDIDFSEMYDSTIKTLSYEQKLKIMTFPDLFLVTSLMKVDQFLLYMDQIQHHYAGQGVQLTYPNEPPMI